MTKNLASHGCLDCSHQYLPIFWQNYWLSIYHLVASQILVNLQIEIICIKCVKREKKYKTIQSGLQTTSKLNMLEHLDSKLLLHDDLQIGRTSENKN